MLVVVLLGSAFFYICQLLGGDRQVMNATDAGALNAARALLSVSVPVASVAPEFQGMGVNVPPDPNQPSLAPGAPDAVNGKYNIFAFNRAAGAALLIAMNALEEDQAGSPNAVDNANVVIDGSDTRLGLTQFGTLLNTALVNSGQLGQSSALAFQNISSVNNVSMMGQNSATTLADNLTFTSVTTGAGGTPGKSNVYFNPACFGGDAFYSTTVQGAQDSTGSIVSVAVPNGNAQSYESQPLYQNGQPFLKAYSALTIDPRIDPIFLCATNPAATPHLIDKGRFAGGTPQFGYAPVNALSGQTQTAEQVNGTNQMTTALACSLVGSIYNQYPVSLVHGFVRIRNGPDARVANPALAGVYGNVDGSGSVFNNELFYGAGGGGGICQSDNGVFGPLWAGAQTEMNYWAAYNTSKGFDVLGHNPLYDPTHGLQFGVFYHHSWVPTVYWPYPNANMRYGSGFGQCASIVNMRGITNAFALYCNTTMYPGVQSCVDNLSTWQSNYGAGYTTTPMPSGQSLTDLEALKAEIISEWTNTTTASGWNAYYSFSTNGSEFANDSGSKCYARAGIGYASPTNTQTGTVAFGTVSSPGELLDQLTTDGATCVDTSDASQWNDPTTILGRLLQRCREILPTADSTMVKKLLFAPGDTPRNWPAGIPFNGVGAPIDLGQCQYIYLPPGASTLAVSTTPPSFLAGLPEYTTPGSQLPDGVPQTPSCAKDSDFAGNGANSPPLGNQINAANGTDGNVEGDNNLHLQPFTVFAGNVDTYDYTSWTSSSGYNDFLGELSFYNHVSAAGTFSVPN
jgi:hypothetical protein